MIKSSSFRQPPPSPRVRDLAAHDPVDPLLNWLKGVGIGRVLLLVGQSGDADGLCITSKSAKTIDMVSTKPSPAMKDMRQLLEGLLPKRDAAAQELWQAALPLEKLLASKEVQQRGVRHTAALTAALRTLSEAQQKQRDRRDVALDTARADPASGSGSRDDETASCGDEAAPTGPDTVLDVQSVWAAVSERSMRPSIVSSSRLPVPAQDGSKPGLVRRGQSFDPRRIRPAPPSQKKGEAPD